METYLTFNLTMSYSVRLECEKRIRAMMETSGSRTQSKASDSWRKLAAAEDNARPRLAEQPRLSKQDGKRDVILQNED